AEPSVHGRIHSVFWKALRHSLFPELLEFLYPASITGQYRFLSGNWSPNDYHTFRPTR
ncbi:MAG: hypothetical protein ACI92N_002589, partial [Pseudomonadales bacterium]